MAPKVKRQDRTILDKLTTTKTGLAVLSKALCPNCQGYDSSGGSYLYRCSLLGGEHTYHGISYPLVARRPCTIEQAYGCPLCSLPPVIQETHIKSVLSPY